MIRAISAARARAAAAPRRYISAVSGLKVAFFGSDNVSLTTLEQLHASVQRQGSHAGLVASLDVVCPSDRPSGRGQHLHSVPVKAFADAHRVRCHTVPYGLRDLKQWDATCLPADLDVGVVVSFGYFMTSNILSRISRYGAINMHPSLLPAYRGAAPIPHALLNGDTETGVSIITIHPSKFDAGAILYQQKVPIAATDTAGNLTPRLAAIGAAAVMQTLADLPARLANAAPQAKDGVTKAPKLRPEQGTVHWSDAGATVDKVMRMAAAFDDSIGIHTFMAGAPAQLARVKLLELARLSAEEQQAADAAAGGSASVVPGSLLLRSGGRLLVRACDGWLQVVRLQPATKKPMRGADFANGHGVRAGVVKQAAFVDAAPV